MSNDAFAEIIAGIKDGTIVPYLGAAALDGAVNTEDGSAIPADSDSLILAMNDGRPMAPRLMWEFARAAMNLELKKGRSFITKFLNKTYQDNSWTVSKTHEWLAGIMPPFVIDINRDLTLQNTYNETPHNLILGCARIGGTDFRFKIYSYDGFNYKEIEQEEMDMSKPLLFKPMGSPVPEAHYIASDADYVDYITELMGGFAIPNPLKEYRKEKQYLFMGLRFQRDTERMVMSDIVFSAKEAKGWAILPEPTEKEIRYCKKMNIEIIDMTIEAFLAEAGVDLEGKAA